MNFYLSFSTRNPLFLLSLQPQESCIMKHSIAHLPKRKQDDLHYLIRKILERIPQTQMIILYGSYATGKYVEYDERMEFGIHTSYMSDYDLLVVTQGARDKKVGQKLDNIEEIYYKDPDLQTPVQFINEDIKALNKSLSEGRYFYTQIKKRKSFCTTTKNVSWHAAGNSITKRSNSKRKNILKKSGNTLMIFSAVQDTIIKMRNINWRLFTFTKPVKTFSML